MSNRIQLVVTVIKGNNLVTVYQVGKSIKLQPGIGHTYHRNAQYTASSKHQTKV